MNGDSLVHGTMAATTVLITIVKLLSLVLNSSSVRISVRMGSSLSSGVRCSWKLPLLLYHDYHPKNTLKTS